MKAINGSSAMPEWNIPIDWIVDLHQRAGAAWCKVYYKTNCGLSGEYARIREYPGRESQKSKAPDVFNYLGIVDVVKKDQLG